jgi:hypothetical protein
MKNKYRATLTVSMILAGTVLLSSLCAAQATLVRVFSLDPAALSRTQAEVVAGNKVYAAALKRLRKDADKVMADRIGSVMDKSIIPPSGDKHDFLSYGRYYWPDPSRPDGLPYIQRDGEVNPEIFKITDQESFGQIIKGVSTLGLAYFYTGSEDYAEHATRMIRVWFLNPETRMNPNVNYGQIVKGKNVGRASGMIEFRDFVRMLDGVGMITGSRAWTPADEAGLKAWFTDYLTWLQTSPIPIQEAHSDNNHGVWFDAQRATIALYLGKTDLARTILTDAMNERIAKQIEPDGTQPRELARTRSMHYTAFNLDAFCTLACIANQLRIDLWRYSTSDGRSLRKALDWFYPYYAGDAKWTRQQIDEFKYESFYPMWYRASIAYGEKKFLDAAKRYGGEKTQSDRALLMFGRTE